jgi:hypothetical protein
LRKLYEGELILIFEKKSLFARQLSGSKKKAKYLQTFMSINRCCVFLQLRQELLAKVTDYINGIGKFTLNWSGISFKVETMDGMDLFFEPTVKSIILPKLNNHFEVCYGWKLKIEEADLSYRQQQQRHLHLTIIR